VTKLCIGRMLLVEHQKFPHEVIRELSNGTNIDAVTCPFFEIWESIYPLLSCLANGSQAVAGMQNDRYLIAYQL
jgi:hypothetical protein